MKIMSWNVNSVRVRTERLVEVLRRHRPDALCLQELKTVDSGFPFSEIEAEGYHAVTLGQKTYNGVAILSPVKPMSVVRNMGDGVADEQARLISAIINGVQVISVYVPNGGVVGSDKWDYKRQWFSRLRTWLDGHSDPSQKVALCGDFNVAIEDRDVHNIDAWANSVLCVPEIRADMQRILDWGFTDTFRLHEVASGKHSWWDYRGLSFPKNRGLRIDYVLSTSTLTAACTDAGIDRNERKGKQPSDHAPVWADFDI
ncbi:MAG: exodeoxyribonuclease III [Bradymonadia bacterium]